MNSRPAAPTPAGPIDNLEPDVWKNLAMTAAEINYKLAVRAQLQRLREALDEIDEEPSADTLALAAQLHREISGAAGRPDGDGPDGT